MDTLRSVFFSTLALLAAAVAFLDLTFSRLGLHAFHERFPQPIVLASLGGVVLVRNLITLSAALALGYMLSVIFFDKNFGSVMRRVSLGFFSVVLVVSALLLLFLPEDFILPFEQVRQVVLSAMVAGYAVVFHIGFSAYKRPGKRVARALLWLLSLSALAALLGILTLWFRLPLQLANLACLTQCIDAYWRVAVFAWAIARSLLDV
ncbi:MAG: hypothetical protein IPJ88_07840 [Myxococcales bacterium]|nr:MAG: hypothetical protein IPJ88_07840 [Myxococcales bacterium]